MKGHKASVMETILHAFDRNADPRSHKPVFIERERCQQMPCLIAEEKDGKKSGEFQLRSEEIILWSVNYFWGGRITS